MSESKEKLSKSTENLSKSKEISSPANAEILSGSTDKLSKIEERILQSASRIQSMQRRKIRLRNAFESDEQGSRIKTKKQPTVAPAGNRTKIPHGK